ncbi:MAG: UDP-N-acetylmuramoyl-L-alanine--D-glutamate ligase [Pigmentiphaga sp.]|nr:UDP-N-acetylmuramoyl-L-alanine--D-glutamate ligase [Pigmentiphaga sp.]
MITTVLRPPGASPLTLVVGLGESGLAAARWCQRAGVAIRVADTREAPPLLEQAREALLPGTDLRLAQGALGAELLQDVGRVVLSPGLAWNSPELAPLLAAARERGVEVVGEIELFNEALAALADERSYRPAVLAITGTNGKTTVTALTTHLVNAGGRRARAAGNIGPAALAALIEALERDDLPEVWVLELSSFQLEAVERLAPHAAAVLNLTEDHLDWHGTMEAYAAAKARIYRGCRWAIVNRDDLRARAMLPRLEAQHVRSFGAELPSLAGDLGMETGSGLGWLVESAADAFGAEPAPRRRKGDPEPGRQEGRLNRLMPAEALLLRGAHNSLNAQAALLLARSLDIGWAPLLRAVREYRGEPHRVAWLRSVGGVDFIDDSKGTNVGATLAALRGLGTKVVLIAGGDGKGQDFAPLAPAVASHARGVVLIGRDAPRLAAALEPSGVPCIMAASLPEAVERAMGLARAGDAVLLSPACASLDMFRDYRHRAEVFAEAVDELALERGEV